MSLGESVGGSPPTVVLDTNVFVAAFWNKRSASADILRACAEGRVHVYYTQQIRREIFLILRNIRSPERYRNEVEAILSRGTEVSAPGELSVVEDDPEDDKFLECALISEADYLITNDDHLLRIGAFGKTRIVRPAEFRKSMPE